VKRGAHRAFAAVALLVAVGLVVVIGAGLLLGSPAPSSPGSSHARPDGEPATVVRVADGDTITVELDGRQERVRYIGIDAPEVANGRAGMPAECGGDAARAANEALVGGASVILERDTSDRDRFGRLLRHVWVGQERGWLLVAERLVATGVAEARSYRPDTSRDAQLDAAERAARGSEVGIWGGC
jgi:micrococcal nuclease